MLLAACHVPGAVRPTVKIGLVAPFEGRYRYVGYDLFPAVRLAVREVNQDGGIGAGTKASPYFVELVAYDDGGDPAMAAQQARKLTVDPDVVVAIGHFREETTRTALPVYTVAGIPLVAPAVFDPGLETNGGTAFRPGPDAAALAVALLEGVEAGALITQGGPLGQAVEAAAGREGVQLAPVITPDQGGWLEAVLEVDPPVILCDADPVTAGEVVAALRAAGWSGEFRGGPELAAADFVAVGRDAAEGAMFVTPWPLPDGEGIDPAFADAYREVSGGMPPGPLALPVYETTRRVLDALALDIAAHNAPSRAGMVSALRSIWERTPDTLYRYRIEGGRAQKQ